MMQDDKEEQEIAFSLSVGEEVAVAGEWGSWEQSRSRSFAMAGPLKIGDGRLGQVANLEMKLELKRSGTGFTGTWTLSMEERIGPWRIDRGQGTGFLVGAGNARLLSFPMPQLAKACGTRRHQWSGTLTKEQFDQVTGFMSDGDVSIRRC